MYLLSRHLVNVFALNYWQGDFFSNSPLVSPSQLFFTRTTFEIPEIPSWQLIFIGEFPNADVVNSLSPCICIVGLSPFIGRKNSGDPLRPLYLRDESIEANLFPSCDFDSPLSPLFFPFPILFSLAASHRVPSSPPSAACPALILTLVCQAVPLLSFRSPHVFSPFLPCFFLT